MFRLSTLPTAIFACSNLVLKDKHNCNGGGWQRGAAVRVGVVLVVMIMMGMLSQTCMLGVLLGCIASSGADVSSCLVACYIPVPHFVRGICKWDVVDGEEHMHDIDEHEILIFNLKFTKLDQSG